MTTGAECITTDHLKKTCQSETFQFDPFKDVRRFLYWGGGDRFSPNIGGL